MTKLEQEMFCALATSCVQSMLLGAHCAMDLIEVDIAQKRLMAAQAFMEGLDLSGADPGERGKPVVEVMKGAYKEAMDRLAKYKSV